MMDAMANKKLEVVFFRSESGTEPVRDWLKALLKSEKKLIGEDVKTLQFGWPRGMPLVDSVGRGLWELRSKLGSNRISRILFFITDSTIVLLHGFIKKTRKTPKTELDLARKRKRLYEISC